MKRIFLTGATGFIGKTLHRHLESQNHHVSVLSKSSTPASGLQANMEEIIKIRKFLLHDLPDVAVLLAWDGLPDYSLKNCLTNLHYQVALIEALIEAKCKRIILAGSCWQYGKMEGEVNEELSGKEIGIFGECKNSVYKMACAMALNKNVEIVEGRIFYAYGPDQRKTSLLPTVFDTLLNERELNLKTPYDAVDFIHVDDIAQAFDILIKSDNLQGIYNISHNQSYQVSEVVNLVCGSLGKKEIYLPHAKIHDWWGCNLKLRQLGFVPKKDLREEIKKRLL